MLKNCDCSGAQGQNPQPLPATPLPDDSPIIAAWRERMGTPAAKTTYKLRAATAECVNAQARAREGVQQSTVRGKAKNRCLALWVAIAHNLWGWIRKLGTALRPQPKATPALHPQHGAVCNRAPHNSVSRIICMLSKSDKPFLSHAYPVVRERNKSPQSDDPPISMASTYFGDALINSRKSLSLPTYRWRPKGVK